MPQDYTPTSVILGIPAFGQTDLTFDVTDVILKFLLPYYTIRREVMPGLIGFSDLLFQIS
jgi:hypothetical protein